MKLLLIRPPRLIWAHVDEETNNILPLAYPYLAAYLRAHLPEVKTTILDCNPIRMGWKSLHNYLKENSFDVIGLGSETIYVPHDLQVLKWIRQYHPKTKIVVGGRHYPFNPKDVFDENLADFIVRGEGEITFCELLRQMISSNPNYQTVAGLIFKDKTGEIVDTGWREPIANLDELPIPAYDMVPIEIYAKRSAFFPNGITIEHGRGCDYGCSFCTFWPQMARWIRQQDGKYKPVPLWRTKSVERTIEECELLVNHYKKSLLWFVDGTFTVDVDWTERFADAVLNKGLKFYWWIFERAQSIVELEKRGALEKVVRAGLRHTLMGVEHPSKEILKNLHKNTSTPEAVREAIDILRKKYPEVMIHITYMGGAPEDNKQTLKDLYKYAKSLVADVHSFHYLTPMPGTELYEKMLAEGKIKVFDYTKYNWFNPVMETNYLTIPELEKYWGRKFITINLHHPMHKIKKLLFGDKMSKRLIKIGATMAMNFTIKNIFLRPFRKSGEKFRSYIKPKWYDS